MTQDVYVKISLALALGVALLAVRRIGQWRESRESKTCSCTHGQHNDSGRPVTRGNPGKADDTGKGVVAK